METKKYVRIKKARSLRNWYSVRIGKMYIVIGENEIEYITHVGVVLKEDAELIVTEKRKAVVGECVLLTAPTNTKGKYRVFDVFTVRESGEAGVRVAEDEFTTLWHKEYEVIVDEVKNEEADEMENVNQTVINNANTVFEKKDDQYFGYKSRFGDIVIGGAYSYRFVVHYAKTNQDVVIVPGDVNTVTTPVCTTLEERLWKPEKTAQARRDEIVEQAKADVAMFRSDLFAPDVEFIVNRKKRTVVALLRGCMSGNVQERGIAKAAPSDCFNVHIGKAIALRRALGSAVPDEYLNAPQPTEVRVGDIIGTPYGRGPYKLKKRHFNEIDLTYLNRCKIIDDSREEVGE